MPDVIFVCSGNTCRSPMAACLFNDFCEMRGLPYRSESAGIHAMDGAPASDGAFYAMKERGLSLARHVAQPFTAFLARDARLVVAMGEGIARVARERRPTARVVTFDPPISDPFGASLPEYRATANDLAGRMDWVLAQLAEAGERPNR